MTTAKSSPTARAARWVRAACTAIAVSAPALLLGACAQEIGDIDRTQPNGIRKADLTDGTWYIRQTVSDVPSTTDTFFVGYTFDTDKVRWEVEQDYLVGYRAYELVPGLGDRVAFDGDGNPIPSQAVNEGRDPTRFREQPVAAYRIQSHFDVQRQYNSATGEQTNVIVENTSDRPWYEREFMRVDWGRNVVASFTFLNAQASSSPVQFYVEENEGGTDALRMEYDGDRLAYVDFVERHFMEPSYLSCVYYLNGYAPGDCVGQQAEVRTSLLRVPAESDYEPLVYDDNDQNKFGYFRTERISYDREYGATLDGRILLANRHNIWRDTWRRNADGTRARDANGQPIAKPFAERTPSPIVYHLSANFPQQLLPYAADMAQGWDRAVRRAVAAAQNQGDLSGWESVRPMFILCNNPVAEAPVWPPDSQYAADCGASGTEVRIGDLRYSVVYWVNHPQQAGPLGYGPSAPDPETGEIISGTAYVYGASVDTYARASLDLIRFTNGDLTPTDIFDASYVRNQVRAARNGLVDPRALPVDQGARLANATVIPDVATMMRPNARARVETLRADLADGRLDSVQTGRGWEQQRIRRIRESGADLLALNDEQVALFGIDPTQQVDDQDLERIRLTSWMNQHNPVAQRSRFNALSRDCILQADHFDDSLIGLARQYEGRTDYDVIYQEIRGMIFRAVMEHEVGHTMGLRHNFAASWDSLNYFDAFWDLKKEGYPSVAANGTPTVSPFRAPRTLADQYGIVSQTEAQLDGRMREFQYASIMDYSSSFNTDIAGLGRYDEAAVLYAYTAGRDRYQDDPSSPAFNRPERGYVEVWENLPTPALNILRQFDQIRGIAYLHPLEYFHYSTIVEAMGEGDVERAVQTLRTRALVRFDDIVDGIARNRPDRPVEVPYMFCSDEYRGLRQSCRTWDRGADPLEQTHDVIQRYRAYYYFDNYRRQRLGWFGSQAGGRAAQRYFFPLVDGYQRWLLNVAIQGGRPDPALDNMWTFAAYAGLNLLAEVITTPNSGSYRANADATRYEFISYGESADAEVYIPEGEGRRRWSRYDGQLGYQYARYPMSAGHYWTYINALFALTSGEASVAGVEVGTFDTTYVIPPYLVFDEELTRLFNAVAAADSASYAPLVTTGRDGLRVSYRPLLGIELNDGSFMNPEDGSILRPGDMISRDPSTARNGIPVDAYHGFSEKVYASILGMSSFTSNYSTRFTDQTRVIELIAGEIPQLAPGFSLVQFCDPTPSGVGKCYGAWQPQRNNEPTMAVDMVLRGQGLADRYLRALEGENAAELRSAEFALDDLLQDINVVQTLSEIFRGVPL